MTATVIGDDVERAVTAADVRAALAELSTENRQVVMEIFFRENSVDEVAQVLGIPAATVISRCFHGLHQLRGTIPS